jgi:hypothetical protein
MSFRVILLTDPVSVSDLPVAPRVPFQLGGREFHASPTPYDHAFYDFVLGADGGIRAVQVQIDRNDPVSQALGLPKIVDSANGVEFSPCLRIWLGSARDGSEAGVEAFGDLLLAQATDGTVAVGFSLDWLPGAGADR